MATKYWIKGGDGFFNGNTNWSLSSGGPNNTTAPVYTDDVVFDSNSVIAGTTLDVKFTSGAISSCQNFTVNSPSAYVRFGYSTTPSKFKITGNFYVRNSGYTVRIYDNVYFENYVGGITFDVDSSFIADATPAYNWFLDHGTFTLLSDFNNLVSTFSVGLESTLDTNGFLFRCTYLTSNYTPYPFSNTRAMSFGASNIYVNTLTVGDYTTMTPGTSTVYCLTVQGYQQVDLHDVTFNPYLTSQYVQLRGTSITFNFNTLTTRRFITDTGYSNNIVNVNTWNIPAGTVGSYTEVGRNYMHFNVGAITGSYSDFRFTLMTGSGALSTTVGTRIGVEPRVTGVLASPSRTLYYSYAAGGTLTNSTTTAYYSNTSGGTPAFEYNVLPQDDLIIDDNSTSSGSTLTLGTMYVSDVDFSSRSLPVTLSTPGNVSFNVYGNFTLSTAVTATRTLPAGFTSIADLLLYGEVEQQITSAGVSMPFTCVIYNTTGSVKLMDNCSFTNSTQFNFYAGNLYLNDKDLSVSLFKVAFDTDAKFLDYGSGTLTLKPVGVSIIFDFSSSGELAFTSTYGEGANLILDNSVYPCTFEGGGFSFPDTTLSGTAAITITGSNTFHNFLASAGSSHSVVFPSGHQYFDSFNLAGSAGNLVYLSSSSTESILKKHNAWFVGSNSVDAGGNTNLYFVPGSDGIDYVSFQKIYGDTYATGTATKNFFFFSA